MPQPITFGVYGTIVVPRPITFGVCGILAMLQPIAVDVADAAHVVAVTAGDDYCDSPTATGAVGDGR